MEPLDVTVVIPTLDEAESIREVADEIPRDLVREIIVVDGGSRDGTAEVAESAGARVVVPGQSGYGRACAAGIAAAAPGCGILVFMDGDGADRGDLMARLVEPIHSGNFDFVIASRALGEREPGSMSWHQLLAGYLAGVGTRAPYGMRYTDMCAYRAIRRDCLDGLGMREMTYGWNVEMQMKAARMGLRISKCRCPTDAAAPASPRSLARSGLVARRLPDRRDLLAGCRIAELSILVRSADDTIDSPFTSFFIH